MFAESSHARSESKSSRDDRNGASHSGTSGRVPHPEVRGSVVVPVATVRARRVVLFIADPVTLGAVRAHSISNFRCAATDTTSGRPAPSLSPPSATGDPAEAGSRTRSGESGAGTVSSVMATVATLAALPRVDPHRACARIVTSVTAGTASTCSAGHMFPSSS